MLLISYRTSQNLKVESLTHGPHIQPNRHLSPNPLGQVHTAGTAASIKYPRNPATPTVTCHDRACHSKYPHSLLILNRRV